MIPIIDRFRPLLESYGIELIMAPVQERLNEDELLALAGSSTAPCAATTATPSACLEACAPRLKVISKWGTGIDSIDQQAAARLGIRVGRTPNAFTLPVADTVLGYMLAFARRQPDGPRDEAGHLGEDPRTLAERMHPGRDRCGQYRQSGHRAGRAPSACTCWATISSRSPSSRISSAKTKCEMTSLEDLLGRSDFVSLNCDLNPTSYHLMNPQRWPG